MAIEGIHSPALVCIKSLRHPRQPRGPEYIVNKEPKKEADHVDPLPGQEEFEFMDDPASPTPDYVSGNLSEST